MADFVYNIKAHPTTYAGVNFRSRLEATWAAFFDLCGVKWQYEPVDFDGWTPDFVLSLCGVNVFTEVKPSDDPQYFDKANAYWGEIQVLRLGLSPVREILPSFGSLMDLPEGATYSWDDLHDAIIIPNHAELWKQAQNITRWKAPRA